jgi:hypothetical protein
MLLKSFNRRSDKIFFLETPEFSLHEFHWSTPLLRAHAVLEYVNFVVAGVVRSLIFESTSQPRFEDSPYSKDRRMKVEIGVVSQEGTYL